MSKEPRVRRTAEDTKAMLEEQLRFIHRSGIAFDEGDQSEAKRISAALRTIWKSSRKSGRANQVQSIGLADQFGFSGLLVDTSIEIPGIPEDRRLISWNNGRPVPQFSRGGFRLVPFEDWWNGVAFLSKSRALTRREVVLGMCNMDGGGHVDEALEEWYHAITRLRDHGIPLMVLSEDGKTGTVEMAPSPLGTIVRQIGHECLKSLLPNYQYDGTHHYGGGGIVYMQATVRPDMNSDGSQDPDYTVPGICIKDAVTEPTSPAM